MRRKIDWSGAVLWLLIVTIVTLMFVAANTEARAGGCVDEVTGEAGIPHPIDGCVTAAEYDAMFSAEALTTWESHAIEGATVADVAALNGVDLTVPASQRPRMFAGVELPSFARIIEGQVAM